MRSNTPGITAFIRKPAVGLLILGILATGGVAVYLGHPTKGVHAAANTQAEICALPAVIAAKALTPSMKLQAQLPQGEPAVVATVNGVPIAAAELEFRVTAIEANYQHLLKTLPKHVPTAIQNGLLEPISQVRQDTLHQMIGELLQLQEGSRLGLTVSVAQTQASMSNELAKVQQLSPNDPQYTAFEAFLCANDLTESTYLSDAQVVHSYRDLLTIAAARQYYLASLPPAQAQTQAAQSDALATHVQQLWLAGSVEIFLPAS